MLLARQSCRVIGLSGFRAAYWHVNPDGRFDLASIIGARHAGEAGRLMHALATVPGALRGVSLYTRSMCPSGASQVHSEEWREAL